MAFQPGHKLSKGKPKGAINKRTLSFLETLERENFDPAKALIEIYREARKTYDNYAEIYQAIEEARDSKGLDAFPTDDKADKYLKIALDAAKDLASYAFPKLKAIEQQKEDPLKDMSPEQKLEAMRHAVQVLELEVKVNR